MVFEVAGDASLDEMISVRLTSPEKLALSEDAKAAGLSRSELVRRRYFDRPIVAHADAVMVRELNRIGGLLKYLHNATGGVYSRETAAVLVELKSFVERLSRDR